MTTFVKVKQISAASSYELKSLVSEIDYTSDFVLVFSDREGLENQDLYTDLKMLYPNSDIVTCSTSGQIRGTELVQQGLVLTSVELESSKFFSTSVNITDYTNSYSAGQALVQKIPLLDLKHIFILSDGQEINGTELVQGINSKLPPDVTVTGGMAGDGTLFKKTLVGLNQTAQTGLLIALGFYGKNMNVSYGSQGGWSPFGPKRLVTKSNRNVLYELDGKSALELYKSYLGDLVNQLPGAALRFPLCLHTNDTNKSLVRTILSVDESNQSMTFAGNVPEGCYVQLMKSNTENIIDGAYDAATNCLFEKNSVSPQLSIMVSCVGRKLFLGQLTEEEIESAHKVLGSSINAGFYSYGEICPPDNVSQVELHNQTMTITTFSEI